MNKPKTQQPETPDKAQGRDLFQTPNYAIDLLIPFIPKDIHFFWEPAAGEGKISRRLISIPNAFVFSSDIRMVNTFSATYQNFLNEEWNPWVIDQWKSENVKFAIITNPPFSLKIKFFYQCLSHDVPFALLIPADYALWNIEAVTKYGCEKIVPTRRIDYITPTGRSGKDSQGQYHSMWLTYKFNLGKSETFVELTNEEKKNNI